MEVDSGQSERIRFRQLLANMIKDVFQVILRDLFKLIINGLLCSFVLYCSCLTSRFEIGRRKHAATAAEECKDSKAYDYCRQNDIN